MNVSGSTSSPFLMGLTTKPLTRQLLPDSESSSTTTRSEAADSFLKFMKQSPEELAQTAWLQRHGITKEQFAAMDPAAKEKLVAQMKEEMKQQAKTSAESQRGSIANILA